MYYIQEADKPKALAKLFNIIQLEGDKLILPISKEEKIESKKAEKLAIKTKKILDKANSKKIIISQAIQKQEEYTNLLQSYEFDMIQGRWLFEALSCQALEYLLEKRNKKKEETRVTILINELSENMLANLKILAKQYKRVSIITNHREKFRQIEKQILEQEGIIITIGNNKKKGLSKAELILNVDFPTELINQYNIYENAIIINLRGNVKIGKKRFNGININDYEITFKNTDGFDYDKETKYKKYEIYEGQINKKQPYQEIIKQLKKDNVKVTKLKGKNTNI